VTGRAPISAVVLTYNEQANLDSCLASLAEWSGEMFVVDSGSTDGTRSIAERHGARIVEHNFETHARQWHWALNHLPLKHEWVIAVDADQRVTPELQKEIVALFTGEEADLDAFDGLYLNRRQIFRGRWIRHGGYYPKYLLKLFRRDRVRIDECDLIDHHFYVPGRTRTLKHDLVEDNVKEADIAFWIEKHNRYARLQARIEAFDEGNHAFAPRPLGSPDERTAWLKRCWAHLPLYVRPVMYFSYRYFIRLGFLDGKQGFIFHFLQAFWYRLVVDIHLDDLKRETRKAPAANASSVRGK
jgi:glycosyltransferase involved in cell wall biosynthesis